MVKKKIPTKATVFNKKKNIKQGFLIFCWALYDLANQFFALNVVFLYFPRWLLLEKKFPDISYSITMGFSMLLIAACAPILGVISDVKGKPKAFLVYFTLLSVVFTIAIGLCNNIFLVLTFFAIANFGCQEAIVFYNTLMVRVAPKNKIGFVSGLGRMFAYIGAILALYLSRPLVLKVGYQSVFVLSGILFLIFSLPAMIFIKDEYVPPEERVKATYFLRRKNILQIFRRLKTTLFDSYKFRELQNVLKAMFFALCAVSTVIMFMSVYISRVFGLSEVETINIIAFSTVFAVGGSIFSGFISDIMGYKWSLVGVFFLWGICILGGAFLNPPFHWLIGALMGISLGSIWVIARALVVKLAPRRKLGEVFGLFNFVGYLSGIIGPLFWGLILLYFSSLGKIGYRLAYSSLLLFIMVAAVFLLRVPRQVNR